jgi:hypothetical protein
MGKIGDEVVCIDPGRNGWLRRWQLYVIVDITRSPLPGKPKFYELKGIPGILFAEDRFQDADDA